MSYNTISNIRNLMHKDVVAYLHRSSNKVELNYINTQFDEFTHCKSLNYIKSHLRAFMDILYNGLNNPKILQNSAVLHSSVDIHELLKTQITTDTKKNINKPGININKLFGLNPGIDLLKAINPAAAIRTAYILLDRKYVSHIDTDNTTFMWQLSESSIGFRTTKTGAVTKVLPRNVIGVKILPFRFPRTDYITTFSNRVSISIHELSSFAYISNEENFKFQFMFTLNSTSNAINAPYNLTESALSSNEFKLGASIQSLNTITISFGNPFKKMALDVDMLSANITAGGPGQVVLTFGVPHFVAVGDIVTIQDFNTTAPAQDALTIDVFNYHMGHVIAAITSTTITLNLSLGGINGAVISPTTIYLDSKRFIIPMEINYISD